MNVSEATPTNLPHRQLLSVIMPVYNAGATLEQQLDALKAQVFDGNWEIVAVDNRSTDDSVEIIGRYQQQLPHLRLVQAVEKQGRAYACNIGAQAAKGNVFLFCDADDVVAPGWLAALAKALEQHDFVAGTLEIEALNPDKAWRPNPSNWATQRNLGFLPFAGGGLMGVSRRAFEAVGGFNEKAPFCEDIDLSWRLQLQGHELQYVPEAMVHVRYRETWQAMWRQTVRFAEAHAYLYKHFAAYGMPRTSVRTAWRVYQSLLGEIPRLWGQEQAARFKWVRRAGVCWGHLKGSVRYHVLYL